MTDLSPAADAVLDAYMANCGWLDGPLEKDYCCAAAVLRVAANTLLNHKYWHDGFWDKEPAKFYRKKLLAIAAELEGAQ